MKKEVDLNVMSFKELKQTIKELDTKMDDVASSNIHPYKIGTNYLIRTVTMIYTGKLEKVYEKELLISCACWIPETNRWMQSVEKCEFKEVEPYPKDERVIIGRGAILDMVRIRVLPTTQK